MVRLVRASPVVVFVMLLSESRGGFHTIFFARILTRSEPSVHSREGQVPINNLFLSIDPFLRAHAIVL
jgi:hypothetical protein